MISGAHVDDLLALTPRQKGPPTFLRDVLEIRASIRAAAG